MKPETANHWHHPAPIFRVANLAASIAYYTDVLGFKVEWSYEHLIASVYRDDCCIFLSEGDQGNPGSWVWIGVADATAMHDELRARGARVRQPPTNFDWALEMQVTDLDGNVMRVGSERLEGVPYGPWMDMNGTLWSRREDGEWDRVDPA